MDVKKIFFEQITSLGGLVFYLFLLLLLISLNFLNESFKLFFLLIISYFLILFIRIIYFIDRPIKKKFNTFIEKIDASSFPSHHSLRITLIILIIMNLSQNIYINFLFIGFGLLVCYSRIYLRKHRFIDIIFGIFFGLLIFYFYDFYLYLNLF